MVKGVEMLLQSQRVTIRYGHADLLGFNQVVVLYGGGKREIIEADSLILAPGSKSKSLPDLLPDGEKIITSDDALRIKRVPKEIVIVGGGYIGVEFATIFSGLGSKVIVVEILENILPGLEGELVRNLRRFLERDGIRIFTKSKVEDLQPMEEGLRLKVGTPQGIETFGCRKGAPGCWKGSQLRSRFFKGRCGGLFDRHSSQPPDGDDHTPCLCHR